MGFVSPAQDYMESRLDLNKLLVTHPRATLLIESDEGFVLVDRSLAVKVGDKVAYNFLGESAIGKLMYQAIITQEGEVIEGSSLEEVTILGKVTYEVLSMHDDCRLVI